VDAEGVLLLVARRVWLALCSVLLQFPFGSKEQHDKILEGIARICTSQGWSTDPLTGREVPAVRYEEDGSVAIGEERMDRASFAGLAHFFPGELRRAVLARDLKVLRVWPRIWMAAMLMVAGAGVAIAVYDFPKLVEGHFSISPIGVVLIGGGTFMFWFQGQRLRKLGNMLADGVTPEAALLMLKFRCPGEVDDQPQVAQPQSA